MREKKENLLIFFLTFSIGSFFFFWKSYSYFLITSKKNISIFLIYSVFIFCENPQLSIKYFIEFFSFFVLGQFRRIHAKKNNNFPSLIFISIKNIKKNACTGEIFSKLLFYLTFSLPSGFSVDFSIFPLLSNEILNNKNIFRETTFLEKLLLRFAKKYSKKDLIKNLIIKNFLKSRFKLKIDNYFEYLSEDLNFTNFLLKKNGKVIIFLYIFLKKNCFDRLIYFSKWNLLLLLQAKKKYTDNIEKIKKIFCQKKKKEKKNKPSAIKNIFLNNLIQDFSYFFTLSPKNTSLFFFRKKSMDLKKYRKNISYNFEFECDNEFKKSKQIFKSNFSLKYFKNHKKLLRKLQKLKGKTFFADPNFFYEKQILENRVLFHIKSYLLIQIIINILAYKISKISSLFSNEKNFQKNSKLFSDKHLRKKCEIFNLLNEYDTFFFFPNYQPKPFGTKKIKFFSWRENFFYNPYFNRISKKIKNCNSKKKFLFYFFKGKNFNLLSKCTTFSNLSRKTRKKEANNFFGFLKKKKDSNFVSNRIFYQPFWFFPLYFLRRYEYLTYFIIIMIENTIKNFKNFKNKKQKFFSSFFNSSLLENFFFKKLSFHPNYQIIHLKCHKKLFFVGMLANFSRLLRNKRWKLRNIVFTRKDYFNIFIRNI